MRCRSLLPAAILVGLSGTQVHAATYNNQRFGYSVFYPDTLLAPQAEAGNGDGRKFLAREGRARFVIFGAYLQPQETPASIERAAERDVCGGNRPSFRIARSDMVAMSCAYAGQIFYLKALVRHGTQTNYLASYPMAEREVWDRVVERMAGSLKPAIR